MSTSRFDRMERLFKAALMHPPEERASFLEAACPDDPSLLEEVQSLLQADAEADGREFLEKPITSLTGLTEHLQNADNEPPNRLIGTEIGPYSVIRFIGHGGMGDVYLVQRDEPFRQQLALKIIRPGMDTREVTRRFEMERQILASLNHPNIGRLFDGGVTADGLPYFAMEFVDGTPITGYADARSMAISDRLRLFQDVCRAVHHAHQNLVIHRDLKPSNILVTGDRIPKLLDFGIAKLLNPHLGPVDAPITSTNVRAMTPEYASPEQAMGESLTTASDIYSLGVILYELLSGQRPYYFRRKTSEEIASVLHDSDPLPPSSVIARPRTIKRGTESVAIDPATVSRARGLTPERLRKRLEGDLDNIVLMAMKKEPERRYKSAEQMADDIERYIEGKPIIAHRDSPGYRLRKYVQRHRVQAIATSIILFLLIIGSVVTVYQANQVLHERDRARLEADRSEEVTRFLVSLFEASDPSYAPGETLTAAGLLENGAEKIDLELTDQPSIQATLYTVIGTAYVNLGEYDRADKILRKSLKILRERPGEEENLAQTLYLLGLANEAMTSFDEAVGYYSEGLEIEARRGSLTTPTYIVGLYHLGIVTHFRGDQGRADSLFDQWESLYKQVTDHSDPELAEATFGMARVYFARREFEKAEEYVTAALDSWLSRYGPWHANVASTQMLLGSVQLALGEKEKAEATTLQALEKLERLYPGGHRDIATTYEQLGRVYTELDEPDRAEEYFRHAIDLWNNSSYGDSLSTALARANLANFYLTTRRYQSAREQFGISYSVLRIILGEKNLVTTRIRISLAESLIGLGDIGEARTLLTSSIERLQQDRDDTHPLLRKARRLLDSID